MMTESEPEDAPKKQYGVSFTQAEMDAFRQMLGCPLEGATLIRAFCLRVVRAGEFSEFIREMNAPLPVHTRAK